MSAKPRNNQAYAFNIRTNAELGKKIEEEARRRGESASFVFREAVREYFAKRMKSPNNQEK